MSANSLEDESFLMISGKMQTAYASREAHAYSHAYSFRTFD